MKTLYHRLELGLGIALVVLSPFSYLIYADSIEIHVADVFRWSGILILTQGLIRDIILLVFYRKLLQQTSISAGILICLESTVGAGLIIVYIMLYLMGAEGFINVGSRLLICLAGLIWIFGYATRDVVLIMKRDPNHLNLALGFR